VLIPDVMTHAVVSADVNDTLRHVGGLMRERNVGSVVVCAGDLDPAQRVTAEVARGAIPEFVFHRRGG
jgi:CBS domain-containing protein